ncbi:hypothetical protein BKE30_08720 [Alkanindiges hydrocarboniclasticus]|uniref:GGDEF domain-containing protein n=1 Tax=Alkanindiges hydrocarboniclasticus TaxID=1907941 RepID=A0A1S8CTT4_9GAMM|nr:diguanylate cyclase [Alkanindiges hydrocarboniclasticus]ONG39843.1 hypothetical protein BKE30_08720 [Alkanindiges hydrocarboniclasticus]
MNFQLSASFEDAGRAVLNFLHQRLDFDLWMITRTEGDDWIVLQSEDHGYQVKPGQVFHWADSFCSHMVQGMAPRIAPCSDDIELYATAPIAKMVPIKAYIGFPLLRENGELFGTLCAIDPQPKPESIRQEQELIDLLSNLLSVILQNELQRTQYTRYFERLQVESLIDDVTQLYDRRAWDRLINAEEERSRRHGHPSAIYTIKMDNWQEINETQGKAASNALIKRATVALKKILHDHDILARLREDEIAILNITLDKAKADDFFHYIRQTLQHVDVKASIGYALRHPSTGLHHALAQAEKHVQTYQHSTQH